MKLFAWWIWLMWQTWDAWLMLCVYDMLTVFRGYDDMLAALNAYYLDDDWVVCLCWYVYMLRWMLGACILYDNVMHIICDEVDDCICSWARWW